MLYESHRRGQIVWASNNEYILRIVDGKWRLAYKKVTLLNNDAAMTTMAFLV